MWLHPYKFSKWIWICQYPPSNKLFSELIKSIPDMGRHNCLCPTIEMKNKPRPGQQVKIDRLDFGTRNLVYFPKNFSTWNCDSKFDSVSNVSRREQILNPSMSRKWNKIHTQYIYASNKKFYGCFHPLLIWIIHNDFSIFPFFILHLKLYVSWLQSDSRVFPQFASFHIMYFLMFV